MISVYLEPKTLFPTELPSNTVFGAICSALSQLGKDVDAMITDFKDKPPFLVSSAFPYVNSDKVYHFLSKPEYKPAKIGSKVDYDFAKEYKKVKFIHEDIFNQWIKGSISEQDIIRSFDYYTLKDGLLFEKDLELNFRIDDVEVPHNVINRFSTMSEGFFYSSGRLFRNSGLYFLIKFNDNSYKDTVFAALRLLEDRGVGGKISSGFGNFNMNTKDIKLFDELNGDYLTTLSRYLPIEINELGNNLWYKLITVRGRSSDGVMKREVKMFGEGSVFPDLGRDYYGGVEVVRDNPPAVEYGFAFPVTVKV